MARLNVRLNHESILSTLEKQAKNKIVRTARVKVEVAAKVAQQKMLEYYDSHPITRELKAGASGSLENISGTIGGNGNLYSFIGFVKGTDPTVPLRIILEQPLEITFLGALKRGKAASDFRFRIGVPSLSFDAKALIDKIERATPIPWSQGESWVSGLKEGISGINHYLYVETGASRSGRGIQIKGEVAKSFNRTDYVGEIFNSFLDALNATPIR